MISVVSIHVQPIPEPPKGKAGFVYDWLRGQIMSGQLLPGEALKQDVIAKLLGVSSTPVREALRQLGTEGLVTHAQHRGVTVSELSKCDVEELYLLRAAMEGIAGRLAARRRTSEDLRAMETILVESEELDFIAENGFEFARLSREFHDVIARTGSPNIVAPRIQQLWLAHPIPGTRSIWNDPVEARELVAVHRQIFESIQAGDELQTESLMRQHIESSGTARASGQ